SPSTQWVDGFRLGNHFLQIGSVAVGRLYRGINVPTVVAVRQNDGAVRLEQCGTTSGIIDERALVSPAPMQEEQHRPILLVWPLRVGAYDAEPLRPVEYAAFERHLL